MKNSMKSMSDLFTKAGEQNCYILDNSNLYVKDFHFLNYLRDEYMRVFDNEINDFEFGYNMPGGGLRLRQLIAKHESHLNQCDIHENDIIISGSGVTGVFSSIFKYWSTLEKKKVIIPTPIYSAIPYGIHYFGLDMTQIVTREENDFILTFSDFVKSYSDDIIGVILMNPCNPVCKFMKPEDIEKIINFCMEKDIYIIVDAIFEEAPSLLNRSMPYFKLVSDYDKFIKIKGVSKDVPHLNDLRIGWSICRNEELNAQLEYYNCMLNYSNSRLSEQIIALDYTERIKEYTIKNYVNKERVEYKNLVVDSIQKLVNYLEQQSLILKVIHPDCGNVIYFEFERKLKKDLHIENPKELAIWIMDHANVLFSPAEYFFHNTDGLWFRMTFCFQYSTMEKLLDKVFSTIERACINKEECK